MAEKGGFRGDQPGRAELRPLEARRKGAGRQVLELISLAARPCYEPQSHPKAQFIATRQGFRALGSFMTALPPVRPPAKAGHKGKYAQRTLILDRMSTCTAQVYRGNRSEYEEILVKSRDVWAKMDGFKLKNYLKTMDF